MDATHHFAVASSRPGIALGFPDVALIDRDEAASLLGVHPRTLERYIANAELGFPQPAKRVGRVRLWNQGDVTRWGKRTLPLATGRPRKP